MHKVAQRQLPLLLFGGGLPQLAKLAGDAKSYAERLFDYPPVGPLDDAGARLRYRARRTRGREVRQRRARLRGRSRPGCYPFFLQVWGSHCWEAAREIADHFGRRQASQRRPRRRRSTRAFSKSAWRASPSASEPMRAPWPSSAPRAGQFLRRRQRARPQPQSGRADPRRTDQERHGLFARARPDRVHGAEVRRIHAPAMPRRRAEKRTAQRPERVPRASRQLASAPLFAT